MVKPKGWRGQSGRHSKAARGIMTGRKKYSRKRSYLSLDQILRKNYGSFPRIEEKLGKRKGEALTTKEDIKKFFKDYPEYEKQAEGVKISLLADRKPSMEIDKRAKHVPGMYLPKEKEIRLFPFKPKTIPEGSEERAKRFYTSKKQFSAVLPHEIYHHDKMPKELRRYFEMPPWKKRDVPMKKRQELEKMGSEHEKGAIRAEDIWFKKLKERESK